MKVTYIGHSGFLLDVEDAYFLFDYYEGEIPCLNTEKPFFIFVSHKHGDHYNPVIFELLQKYPKTQFILSKDVPVKWKIEEYISRGIALEKHITVMRKWEEKDIVLSENRKINIKTLRSTDMGVAYLLSYKGKCYYHAGDLNLWLWAGETKHYNDNMRVNYFKELEKLRGLEIEAAFVPLDPRQEEDAFAGMESFMEYTKTKHIFPMHFWNRYEIIRKFLEKYPEEKERVIQIEKQGQVFEWN